jgi:hypothetical protein
MTGTPFLTLRETGNGWPTGRRSAAVIWALCRRGVKARNGARVRLEHVRDGRRILIAADAPARFLAALAAADLEYFDSAGRANSLTPRRSSKPGNDRMIVDAEVEVSGKW